MFEDVIVESNQILAIGLLFCQNVVITDCLFDGNMGSTINALDSKVVLEGNTEFTKNKANRGGAISLSFSTLIFANNSNILFRNNSAREVGGAVLVVSKPDIIRNTFGSLLIVFQEQNLADNDLQSVSCFYQLEVKDYEELTSLNINVTFENNSAMFGGETMYGATFYANCQVSHNFMIHYDNRSDVDFIVDNTLHVTDTVSANSLSSVSSDPARACFCDQGVPQCANTSFLILNETRYPGEKFDIPLVIVGNQFGTLTASVYADLVIQHDHHATLGAGQHLQGVEFSTCNNVGYSVHSSHEHETIILTANKGISNSRPDFTNLHSPYCKNGLPNIICLALLRTPIIIDVTLEKCPLGFELAQILFLVNVTTH